jgi:hypothetical protein
LLASTGSGLDQSTTSEYRTEFSYVDDGCLNSSRASSFLAVTVTGSHIPIVSPSVVVIRTNVPIGRFSSHRLSRLLTCW